MLKLYIPYSIILLLLSSCTNSKKSYDIDFCVLNKLEMPHDTSDLIEFNRNWNQIYQIDTLIIDFIIENRNNFHGLYYIDNKSKAKVKFGFLDSRTYYYKNNYPYIDNGIALLYIITALYYDNYYFASDIILYSKNDIVSFMNLSTSEKTVVNKEYVNKAWESIIEWRKEVSGMTLNEIRKQQKHPLAGTDLIWLGEEGCLINSRFKHNPIFYDSSSNDGW